MQPDRTRGLALPPRTNFNFMNAYNSPFNATRLSSFAPMLGPTQMQKLLRPSLKETISPPKHTPQSTNSEYSDPSALSIQTREELLGIMQSIVGSSTSVEELTNILVGAGDDIQIALNHWAQRWWFIEYSIFTPHFQSKNSLSPLVILKSLF